MDIRPRAAVFRLLRALGRKRAPAVALALGAAVALLASCETPREERQSSAAAAPGPVAGGPEAPRSGPRVVVLGDSLTAGLGLEASEAYPALLQQRIDERGWHFVVVNQGHSGDTTAGALSRLESALDGDVRVLVVALGGNDGLRGLPVEETRRNLTAIVKRARSRDIAVLLAGMEAPPNYGEQYTTEFRQTFRDVAREEGVAFVPFLLEGVAGDPALNQADGIHPTAEGAGIVAGTIWSALAPLLDAARAS